MRKGGGGGASGDGEKDDEDSDNISSIIECHLMDEDINADNSDEEYHDDYEDGDNKKISALFKHLLSSEKCRQS